MLKWLYFWVYKVVTTETHQSKTLLFSKGTLAVTDKWLQKSRRLYLMHSTSLLGLLKEFWRQNSQNSGRTFDQRPNFFKWELRLWPNIKNTASVIHCIEAEHGRAQGLESNQLVCPTLILIKNDIFQWAGSISFFMKVCFQENFMQCTKGQRSKNNSWTI